MRRRAAELSTVPVRTGLGPAYPPAVRDLRWAITGLVVGTTLLSGCSEKVEANDTLPSTSAAPTTEALPPVGPADFPVPAEARTKDAAGAEAFLRYWIDLLNRQRAIPAGQPLRDLGPDCDECLRIARNYDDAAAAGNRYVGGELTLNDVPPPVISGDEALISFGVRRESVSLVDSSGTAVEARPDPAPNLGSGIDLVWSSADASWLVTGLSIG
jgi:hypothetical protein